MPEGLYHDPALTENIESVGINRGRIKKPELAEEVAHTLESSGIDRQKDPVRYNLAADKLVEKALIKDVMTREDMLSAGSMAVAIHGNVHSYPASVDEHRRERLHDTLDKTVDRAQHVINSYGKLQKDAKVISTAMTEQAEIDKEADKS